MYVMLHSFKPSNFIVWNTENTSALRINQLIIYLLTNTPHYQIVINVMEFTLFEKKAEQIIEYEMP